MSEKYKMFKQFMHNELGITKEDIREWVKESVSDEVSWQKVDPTAAAAASGEEDITEGGAGQGGNQGGGTTGGELEG